MRKKKGNIAGRIAALRQKHGALEAALENLGRNPCSVASKMLKRQKLLLKEEIVRLSADAPTVIETKLCAPQIKTAPTVRVVASEERHLAAILNVESVHIAAE